MRSQTRCAIESRDSFSPRSVYWKSACCPARAGLALPATGRRRRGTHVGQQQTLRDDRFTPGHASHSDATLNSRAFWVGCKLARSIVAAVAQGAICGNELVNPMDTMNGVLRATPIPRIGYECGAALQLSSCALERVTVMAPVDKSPPEPPSKRVHTDSVTRTVELGEARCDTPWGSP